MVRPGSMYKALGDRTVLQNAAILGRIETKVDQLLRQGLTEGPTGTATNRAGNKPGDIDKKSENHYNVGKTGGFNWKARIK